MVAVRRFLQARPEAASVSPTVAVKDGDGQIMYISGYE